MLRLGGSLVLAGLVAAAITLGPSAFRLIEGAGRPALPEPARNRAVYDPAGAVTPEIEGVLEQQIDAIEARSGAEVVVYVRIDGSATDESNLVDARSLIDQWGIGRAGYDDGFVILLSFDDETFQHGVLSTFAGSGFQAVYLNADDQQRLREEVIIPAIQQGALDGGLLAAMDALNAAISPDAVGRLEGFRVINAILGIPGGILALFLSLGIVYVAWRRYGDDPELADSPSVLMAGPPAGMTPPLATVLRSGRATQHSINTTLVDLAGQGLISFRNLDQVKRVKSDDAPDPLVDPAIEVLPAAQAHSKRLPPPQRDAYAAISNAAIGSELTRDSLWSLNDTLKPVRARLESEAVRLGWLTQRPTPIITRWVVIGLGEILLAAGLVWLGYTIPMSGLTLLGAALAIGGIGTVALGNAMSQRTPRGAYVDAMLKAYRRTLQKTLELAQNMREVVQQPEVRVLADTPDKAVVWGIALGLHRQVAAVLERGLADPRAATDPQVAYYPTWLGSSSGSGGFTTSGGTAGGMAGLLSASGTPDIGGMFSALGSVGSSPPSSSSGGGGFGGGGSSGGGGGSSSF